LSQRIKALYLDGSNHSHRRSSSPIIGTPVGGSGGSSTGLLLKLASLRPSSTRVSPEKLYTSRSGRSLHRSSSTGNLSSGAVGADGISNVVLLHNPLATEDRGFAAAGKLYGMRGFEPLRHPGTGEEVDYDDDVEMSDVDMVRCKEAVQDSFRGAAMASQSRGDSSAISSISAAGIAFPTTATTHHPAAAADYDPAPYPPPPASVGSTVQLPLPPGPNIPVTPTLECVGSNHSQSQGLDLALIPHGGDTARSTNRPSPRSTRVEVQRYPQQLTVQLESEEWSAGQEEPHLELQLEMEMKKRYHEIERRLALRQEEAVGAVEQQRVLPAAMWGAVEGEEDEAAGLGQGTYGGDGGSAGSHHPSGGDDSYAAPVVSERIQHSCACAATHT
jgi:hypothetical protein